MKLLKVLVVLVLVSLPLGEVIRVTPGNNIAVKPLDFFVVLTAISWLGVYIFGGRKLYFDRKLFIFPAVASLALLFNVTWLKPSDFLVALLYLIRFTAFIPLFFVIRSSGVAFQKKIFTILFIDGLIVTLLGYVQYFLYPNLKNLYYLGWDEHLYRLFSVFLDPNFAGAFLVLYLFFVTGLALYFLRLGKKKYVICLGVMMALVLIAVFLTYSRSALLMLIGGTIVFGILSNKKRYIFALLGAVLLFIVIISPSFYIENLNLFRVNSSLARVQSAQLAFKIFQDHPVLGIGFDAYRYAQIKYHFKLENPKFPSHADAGVDNSFLFVLVTTGILGIVAYGFFWRYALGTILRKKRTIMSIVFVSSIVGLFINALFINSLFYPSLLTWIFILLGCTQLPAFSDHHKRA